MKRRKESTFSVVSFNVHFFMDKEEMNYNFLDVKSFLQKHNYDFIILNEAVDSSSQLRTIQSDLQLHKVYLYEKMKNYDLGNAMLTKLMEIKEREILPFYDGYRSLLRYRVFMFDEEKIPLDICCTHLCYKKEKNRMTQMEFFLKNMNDKKGEKEENKRIPRLICGDFNAMTEEDYSEKFINLRREERRKWGWQQIQFELTKFMKEKGYTDVWKLMNPNLKDEDVCTSRKIPVRIDYMFCNEAFLKYFGVKSCKILRDVTCSDHFPLVSRFFLRKNGLKLKND